MSKSVSLNADTIREFLSHMIDNNRYLQEAGKIPVSVEVEGPSGIGKTSILTQLAEEKGLSMVRLNIAQVEELGDIIGFPLRQFEMCMPLKETELDILKGESECEWVDEHAVSDYSKMGYTFTGNNRMSYCPPEWISNIDKGGILLLDDYTRADPRFLQACMTLIETQEYISWKLPKDWHIILTSNPDNGDYHVNVLDTAQKTRFISVNLKFDIDCWAKWAEKAKIDGRCINFLLLHPELVTETINARSITNFFNSISSIKDFEKKLPLIQMIGEGSVGEDFSNLFSMFIANKLDKLISPKVMINEKDYEKIKAEMIGCIGNPYRADIASVLGTRIVNYCVTQSETGIVSQGVINRIIKFSTDDKVLQNDIRYYMVKNLLSRAREKFQGIMIDPEVVLMAVK